MAVLLLAAVAAGASFRCRGPKGGALNSKQVINLIFVVSSTAQFEYKTLSHRFLYYFIDDEDGEGDLAIWRSCDDEVDDFKTSCQH